MAAAFDAGAGLVIHVIQQYGKPTQTWACDAAGSRWALLKIPGLDAGTPPVWLDYDAEAGCLVGINTGMHKGRLVTWALRLEPATAARVSVEPAGEEQIPPPEPRGELVLRDAVPLEKITRWKRQTDDWLESLPANTWVVPPMHGTGRMNWGRTWSSVVHDPDRRQLYYRDGGHGSFHGSVTDHYDIPTGRWFRDRRNESPPLPHTSYFAWGRSFDYAPFCIHTYKYGLFYNPLVRRLQRVDVKAPKRYDDPAAGSPVHQYDPDTGSWSRQLAHIPWGGSAFTSPIVPGVPDGVLCVEAFSRYGVLDTTRLWYRTAGGLKALDDTGRLPRYHDCHAVCFFFDPKRRRVLYYGGPKGRPELHALSVDAAEPKWARLDVKAAAGTLPVPSREVVYVPKHDTFLMLESLTDRDAPPAVWALVPGANTLSKITLAVGEGIEAGKNGLTADPVSTGLAYDPRGDVCFYTISRQKPRMYAFRYAPK